MFNHFIWGIAAQKQLAKEKPFIKSTMSCRSTALESDGHQVVGLKTSTVEAGWLVDWLIVTSVTRGHGITCESLEVELQHFMIHVYIYTIYMYNVILLPSRHVHLEFNIIDDVIWNMLFLWEKQEL